MTDIKKDIKDYLHLYLGCECKIADHEKTYFIRMVNETGLSVCIGTNTNGVPIWYKSNTCKPSLRPLSSIKKEEFKDLLKRCFDFDADECYKQEDAIWGRKISTKERFRLAFDFEEYNNIHVWKEFTEDYKKVFFPLKNIVSFINECRKMSFDMDGLIKAGLAIEKKS